MLSYFGRAQVDPGTGNNKRKLCCIRVLKGKDSDETVIDHRYSVTFWLQATRSYQIFMMIGECAIWILKKLILPWDSIKCKVHWLSEYLYLTNDEMFSILLLYQIYELRGATDLPNTFNFNNAMVETEAAITSCVVHRDKIESGRNG